VRGDKFNPSTFSEILRQKRQQRGLKKKELAHFFRSE